MSGYGTGSPIIGESQPRKIYALVDQITPSTYRMSHSIFKPNFFLRRNDRKKTRKGPELIKDSQKDQTKDERTKEKQNIPGIEHRDRSADRHG